MTSIILPLKNSEDQISIPRLSLSLVNTTSIKTHQIFKTYRLILLSNVALRPMYLHGIVKMLNRTVLEFKPSQVCQQWTVETHHNHATVSKTIGVLLNPVLNEIQKREQGKCMIRYTVFVV